MSKLMRQLERAILVVAVLLLPSAARADFFIHNWELEHEPGQLFSLGAEELYYTTNTNYGATGSPYQIPGLNSYNRAETDVTGAYGVTNALTVYARATWDAVQVNLSSGPGSVFGLGDQSVGGSFRIFESKRASGEIPIGIYAQVQADFPAYSVNTFSTSNEPVIGDGSLDVTGGGFLSFPVSQNRENAFLLTAGVGYTYRTEAFSSAIPWSAKFQYVPKAEGLSIELAGLGLTSLQNDPNAFNQVNGVASRGVSGTGGSFITEAINPSLISVRAKVGYVFSPQVTANVAYERSVWGEDSPSGNLLMVGVDLSFGKGASGRPGLSRQTPEVVRSNEGFVKYSLEAHVTRASDRLNLVKIDKGSEDGVEMGQLFDIFSVKQDGSSGDLIARAEVTAVKSNEAALTIQDYYKEVLIDEGFVARRLIH